MVTPKAAALPERNRHAFDWPEPLIIDLLGDVYSNVPGPERLTIARLHTRALRSQVDGDKGAAALSRLDLIAACAARNIGMATIEEADRASFAELNAIAESRYRNSPHRRDALLLQLAGALAGLTPTAKPSVATVPRRTWARPLPAVARAQTA